STPSRRARRSTPRRRNAAGSQRAASRAAGEETMRHLAWLAALGVALMFGQGAAAQAWPNRPITVVVPFPAGSTTDIAGRIAGNELAKRVNQQVVIDNRGGAGGLVGAEYVAHAAPDGYTLLLGTISSHSIVPHMYSRMPYDPIGDFTPIAQF